METDHQAVFDLLLVGGYFVSLAFGLHKGGQR